LSTVRFRNASRVVIGNTGRARCEGINSLPDFFWGNRCWPYRRDAEEEACGRFRRARPEPSGQRMPASMHAPTTAAESARRTRALNRAMVMGRSWASPAQNHSRMDRSCRPGATSGFVRPLIARRGRDDADRLSSRRDSGSLKEIAAAESRSFRPACKGVGRSSPRSGVRGTPAVERGGRPVATHGVCVRP